MNLTEAGNIESTWSDQPRFPESLRALSRPPETLWSIGNWETLRDPVVAIVGTRSATVYGERVAREISAAMARAGACVVSGMARGIDGVAHRAALDVEGGRTVAVLGTGVDIAYPRGHRSLHHEIAQRGLLLSELRPGDHAHPGSFPNRNRIIAALASVTIIVEAPIKSGALRTAEEAAKLGRTVGAVPGPIDVPQSEGCNRLILDNAATILTSIADALALARLSAPALGGTAPEDPLQRRLWTVLKTGPLDMDGLCAAAMAPAHECLAAVSAMELRGVVDCELTGQIRLR